jgi:iron complex outermembrane recepter protein
MLDKQHSAWGAISRAVRTPSRVEEQITATLPAVFPDVFPRAIGSPNLVSEDLLAYEIGYREQTNERFSWDVATFYNVYGHLLGAYMGSPFVELSPLPPHLIIPSILASGDSAETYGVELAGTYSVFQRWRLYAQYTFFEQQIHNAGPIAVASGTDPHNQVYLRSSWDLRKNLEFDLMARYVDRIAALDVPRYISMDLRLGWRPREHWELAVVGQNLLQTSHQEYAGNSGASAGLQTDVPRGVYGTVTWRH